MLLLVDTDVAVDLERRIPAAVEWVRAHANDEIAIVGYTAIELVAGCANKLETRRVQSFVSRFRIYWPDHIDCARALATWPDARLTHGIGIGDQLIGECAVGLQVPLQTFNAKHFRAVPALTFQQPYQR